jgi:carboxyl-terminal processing protease
MLQSLDEANVNRQSHSSLLGIFAAICLAGLGFLAGYLVRGQAAHAFPLLSQAHVLLQEHYLDPLPDETLLQRGMIRGMLQELGDPFTIYVEPASHELESDQLSGEYGGIGVLLTLDQEGNVHLVPAAGGPADLAGVQEGDILTAINGAPLEPGAGLEVVSAALRGPAGTRVRLTLLSGDSGDVRQITVVREVIPLPSVTGYLMPDDRSTGVLAVTSFTERTPDELSTAYTDLRSRGAEKMILDLRGNSGGLLDSGIDVARYFLGSGVVVIERGREGDEQVHRVEQAGAASETPLAVIIDGATASAAEIVAAALQENSRAPLIGQPSYGKGSVQLIFDLSDGSSLHVTSARWLTPSGNQIDGVGLRPDVPVDPAGAAQGSDPFLQAALGWLNGPRDGAP